jgi:putative tricarboxylic transport membrane protein
MKRYDEISSLVWMSLAIFICIESTRLPFGSWRDPGAGFFPLLSGIFLGFLSGLTLVRAFLNKKEELREKWYPQDKWKSLISVLMVLIGYAVFLEILGFLLSTFLLLVFLFRGIEPQRWIVAIGGSALASVISYAVFELWLKTQLPKGILGF